MSIDWNVVGPMIEEFVEMADDGPTGDTGARPRFEIEYSNGLWSANYREPDDGRHGDAYGRWDEGLAEAMVELRRRVLESPERQRNAERERLAMTLSMFLGSKWSPDQAKEALALLEELKLTWDASPVGRERLLYAMQEGLLAKVADDAERKRMATGWSPPK